jgi:hypothetical protein
LKKLVPQPNKDKKKMKELVIRMVYVEMLGQDASFAYIKAVELCAATSVAQKKAGYLAGNVDVTLFFVISCGVNLHLESGHSSGSVSVAYA